MASIFVSYRRKDTTYFVRGLCGRLAVLRPHHDVFVDVDRIQAGRSFPEQLDRALAQCQVVLVVIGERWPLEPLQQTGDWVRQEVELALARGKRVIPVLVDDARMPVADQLPETVRPLVHRQAVRVRYDRYDDDLDALVATVRRVLAEEAALAGATPASEPAPQAGGGGQGPLGTEVSVPPGEFVSENWDTPQRIEGFRMMATPVTEAHWQQVMGESRGKWGADCPVTQVNWGEAVAFCNALSERAGLEPAYAFDDLAGGRVRWKLAAPGYRLPTEREWEYACRAGTTTGFSWGDDEALAGSHTWFEDNSGGSAQPVAAWSSDPWGLFDMHGNVWEWCWTPYKMRALITEPVILMTQSGPFRVCRGGSFVDGPRLLRSAYRHRFVPTLQPGHLGFRCVSGSRRHP